MKAIILAAGYATRLFPLTENRPKPLLPINGRPMIDYIVDKITELGITEIFVVTNQKFHSHFEEWAAQCEKDVVIKIINDKTTSDDDKLGAVGDIMYTVKEGGINDDFMVIGGDNLFKFSLKKAHEIFLEKKKSTIVAYDVKDLELAKKYGVIAVDENNKVTSFEEKPQEPKSTLCAICVYFYPKEVIGMFEAYKKAGEEQPEAIAQKWMDPPGNLPAWLVKTDEVYGIGFDDAWYDVGGFESLKEAKEDYGEENVSIEALKQGNI